jgi:putative ATP-binding cassette transporter
MAFASLLLHAPHWVLIDEVLDSLDEDSLQRVSEVLTKDLEHTGIVYIGRAETRNGMFSKVVHLIKDPGVRRLHPNPVAVAARAQSAAA